jgi:hypothetical protein
MNCGEIWRSLWSHEEPKFLYKAVWDKVGSWGAPDNAELGFKLLDEL